MTEDRENRMPDAVADAARALGTGEKERAAMDMVDMDMDGMFTQLQGRIDERSALDRLSDLPSVARVGIAGTVAGLLVFASDKVAWSNAGTLMLAACATYAVGLGGLVTMALRPAHRPSLSPQLQWTGIALTCLAVVGFAVMPGTTGTDAAPPAGMHFKCLGFGTAVALPVFFLLRLLDRGQRYGPWLAAFGAGTLGNLALQVHCPSGDPAHRLIGHATVLVLLAVLGFALRRRPGATA